MKFNNNLEFKDVKEFLIKFMDEDSSLKYSLLREDDSFIALINCMLKSVEYALEHQESPVWEETLDDREKQKIIYLNYLLPSYYLSDKYDNIKEFLESYVLLVNNYSLVYKEQLVENFINSVVALNNLMKVENHFARLIEISEVLITKYEKGKAVREEPFTISKTYLKELLEEAENTK